MRTAVLGIGLAASALALASVPVSASSPVLETITTPRGVKQSLIVMKPDKPVATVLLFAGGHGALKLVSATQMKWGAGNFLVRSRQQFVDQGFIVAVVDAPADRAEGMNAVFRMSSTHGADIGAIVQHMRKIANVPVWAVGTSMGTFSAARAAIGSGGVDGLVLSSTITRAKPAWKIKDSHRNGVASMPLGQVKVPTLILSHRKDGCDITPAADAPKLKAALSSSPRTDIRLLDGGSPPQSDPCEARSAHGFLGIEAEAVSAIADFIKRK